MQNHSSFHFVTWVTSFICLKVNGAVCQNLQKFAQFVCVTKYSMIIDKAPW